MAFATEITGGTGISGILNNLVGDIKVPPIQPIPSKPPASPTSPPPAASTGSTGASSLSGDPVLQRIIAGANKAISDAQALALHQRTAALIDYGYDSSLDYGDATTAAAAKNNPYSILAMLAKQYGQNQLDTNEAYNKQNLFYSGHRADALLRLADAYGKQQYDAKNALTANLTGISTNELNAENAALGVENQGYGDAYNRAISQAQYGYGGTPGSTSAPVSAGSILPSTASIPAASSLLPNLASKVNVPAAVKLMPKFKF